MPNNRRRMTAQQKLAKLRKQRYQPTVSRSGEWMEDTLTSWLLEDMGTLDSLWSQSNQDETAFGRLLQTHVFDLFYAALPNDGLVRDLAIGVLDDIDFYNVTERIVGSL